MVGEDVVAPHHDDRIVDRRCPAAVQRGAAQASAGTATPIAGRHHADGRRPAMLKVAAGSGVTAVAPPSRGPVRTALASNAGTTVRCRSTRQREGEGQTPRRASATPAGRLCTSTTTATKMGRCQGSSRSTADRARQRAARRSTPIRHVWSMTAMRRDACDVDDGEPPHVDPAVVRLDQEPHRDHADERDGGRRAHRPVGAEPAVGDDHHERSRGTACRPGHRSGVRRRAPAGRPPSHDSRPRDRHVGGQDQALDRDRDDPDGQDGGKDTKSRAAGEEQRDDERPDDVELLLDREGPGVAEAEVVVEVLHLAGALGPVRPRQVEIHPSAATD